MTKINLEKGAVNNENQMNKFIPVGNSTEVGLLKFLQNADVPIHTEINRRFDLNRCFANVPLRVSSPGSFYTACAVDEGDGEINIHIKGAPEALIPMAQFVCGPGGELQALDEDAKARFLHEVETMASMPLRVIAFAHAQLSKDDWDALVAEHRGLSDNEILKTFLNMEGGANQDGGRHIKLVGALGLEDKVRPKAKSALRHAMGPADDPRVTVRMLTGDSKATA